MSQAVGDIVVDHVYLHYPDGKAFADHAVFPREVDVDAAFFAVGKKIAFSRTPVRLVVENNTSVVVEAGIRTDVYLRWPITLFRRLDNFNAIKDRDERVSALLMGALLYAALFSVPSAVLLWIVSWPPVRWLWLLGFALRNGNGIVPVAVVILWLAYLFRARNRIDFAHGLAMTFGIAIAGGVWGLVWEFWFLQLKPLPPGDYAALGSYFIARWHDLAVGLSAYAPIVVIALKSAGWDILTPAVPMFLPGANRKEP